MVKRIADLEGLVLGLMTLASGYMFFQTFSYPRIPAELPRLVSFITLALCLFLFGGRLVGKTSPMQFKKGIKTGADWRAFSLALFGYYAGIQVVGLLPATAVFLALITIWVSGTTARWRLALVYAVVVTALLGAAMGWLMKIPIPSGILFR